jgi:hypothetical protein
MPHKLSAYIKIHSWAKVVEAADLLECLESQRQPSQCPLGRRAAQALEERRHSRNKGTLKKGILKAHGVKVAQLVKYNRSTPNFAPGVATATRTAESPRLQMSRTSYALRREEQRPSRFVRLPKRYLVRCKCCQVGAGLIVIVGAGSLHRQVKGSGALELQVSTKKAKQGLHARWSQHQLRST